MWKFSDSRDLDILERNKMGVAWEVVGVMVGGGVGGGDEGGVVVLRLAGVKRWLE